MEIGTLITWAIGVVVAVLSGVWARTAATIARNGRETAELRGRVDALEAGAGDLKLDVGNAHRRISGVGRTADRNAGVLEQARNTLAIITRRLIGGGEGEGGGG